MFEGAYDEQTPLEEMRDRVIDIAGHMQKAICRNMRWRARSLAPTCATQIVEPVRQRAGFSDAGKAVDGDEVYQWTPADRLQYERAAS